MVVWTMGYEKEQLGERRELKILKAVEGLGDGNIRGSMWRRKRRESWLRPPPGGAQTGSRVVSTTCLKKSLVRS